MELHECAPSESLRPFVDRFWALRVAPGQSLALADLLPGTGSELMLHLGPPVLRATGAALPASHLLCLRATTLQLAPVRGLDMFCVRFRAGALRHFVAEAVGDLVDANAAFGDAAGPVGRALLERIADATGFVARVAIAEAALLALRARFARPDVRSDRAVARIYAARGRVRIAALARELEVGPRHLTRQFRAAAGVGARQFASLARFQAVVRTLLAAPGADLARVAVGHGYTDHAHLAHEFRALAGQSATAFLRGAANRSHFYKPSIAR